MTVVHRRALVVAIPALVGLVAWGTWRGLSQVRASQQEASALESRCAALRQGNEQLRREVEALRREREARVRAARETLDVAAPSEVVVLVPEARAGVAPATPPPR